MINHESPGDQYYWDLLSHARGISFSVPVPQVRPWGSLGAPWGPARKNLTVDLLWTSWRAKGFTTRSSLETERDDGLPIMAYRQTGMNQVELWNFVEGVKMCQASSETKWWLDDPPKVAGYTTFMKLPHWPHHRLFLTTLCFGVGGKSVQNRYRSQRNLPHAARLLDSPRATCYFLQPHSNWMNHNAATSAFQMEKLDRNSGNFLSSICIPSWKYWWINHGITSYWNHDTR